MSILKNKKFLIIGALGQLGREFSSEFDRRSFHYVAPEEKVADITDFSRIAMLLDNEQPDIVINCAAYNAVDNAEDDEATVMRVNSEAVRNLAEVCDTRNIFLVHFSSDYVFSGRKMDVYTEQDRPDPLNVYGKSKLLGETAVLEHCKQSLVFRLSWVIGKGTQNFLYKLTQWSRNNHVLKISADETSVPTFTDDIVEVTLLALEKGLHGLYHLTNSGYASRYELARSFITLMGLSNLVVPVAMSTFQTKAARPLFSCMSNKAISQALDIEIPDWKDRLCSYVEFLKSKEIE